MNETQYDSLAAEYHWLYSDRVLTGEPFLEEVGGALKRVGRNARILDCACGIGVHAIALSRQGYDVSGTDASPGMVDVARRRAKEAGVVVSWSICPWAQLAEQHMKPFDMVLCYGNAIGHCRNENEMLAAFRGLRAVLRLGGLLVIESRNWEKVCRERVRFSAFGVRRRNGIECIPLYVWNFPKDLTAPHEIEVVLIFSDSGRVTLKTHSVVYYPFRYEDLIVRMKTCGFETTDSDFDVDSDSYRVILQLSQ